MTVMQKLAVFHLESNNVIKTSWKLLQRQDLQGVMVAGGLKFLGAEVGPG